MLATEFEAIIGLLRRQKTDDANVEVKTCSSDLSKDIWESVSAFGNTHGGTIILGIDEKSGFLPTPNFNIDKVRDQFVSGIGDGGVDGVRLTNPPHYEMSRQDFEGAQVLVIEVSEVDPQIKPCFITARGIQGGSYKRVDDKDIRLSPAEVYALQNLFIPSQADRELVENAEISDLDFDVIDQLVENERSRGSKSIKGAETREAQMTRLNIIDKQGDVTLAGMLAAGTYPQQFYPKLVVDVAVHPDTEKSSPDGPRFLDRTICEGFLGEVIEESIRAVAKNLRRHSIVEGVGRKEVLEIPEEVLREAITNAVIHREYSPYFTGQSVSVDVFPDRVVITNPGGLWGGKTLSNIADGTSRCRNAVLMRLMSSTPLPSGTGMPAEGGGTGVPLMIREMKSCALNAPLFEATIDCFRVTLGRSGTEIPENRIWIRGFTGDGLTQREEAILLAARRDGQASVKSIRDMLRIDSDEIREAFANLTRRGALEQIDKDTFCVRPESRGSANRDARSAEETILSTLSHDTPMDIHEIAAAIGKSLASTRLHMRSLIECKKVKATAPSTSKNRKYLLNGSQEGIGTPRSTKDASL